MAITILTGVIIIIIIIAKTLAAVGARHSSKCFSYTVCIILIITLLTTLSLPHESRTCVLQKELLLKIKMPVEQCGSH